MRRSLAAVCSLLALMGGVGGVAPASAMGEADGGWGPVLPVSRVGADVWDVDLALGPRGRGLAAWVRWTEEGPRLMAATQRRDGRWRVPSAVPGARGAAEVEVAYDARGRALLAWTRGYTVRTSWRSVSGRWSRPVVVARTPSGELGTRPQQLQLSVNADGAAVVAWQTVDDDEAPPYATSGVQAVTRTATGGWSRVRTLSGARPGARPEVYVDGRGRATAVWTQWFRGNPRVMTASRAARGAWTEPRRLTRALVEAGTVHLTGLPSGDLAVAYGFRSGERRGLRVWRWEPGSGWQVATTTAGALPRGWMDAGMAGSGEVVVAHSNAADAVWVTSVSSSGAVTTSRLQGDVSVYYGMHVTVNAAGDALVAWDSVRGGDHPIEGAYRSRTGEWTPVQRISARRGDAFLGAVAVSRRGDGLAVWSGGDIRDPDSSLVWSRARSASR